MKLDINPDDAGINRHKTVIGTLSTTKNTKLYLSGLIRAHFELDLTGAGVVVNGSATTALMLTFAPGDTPFTEWLIMRAILSCKGFAGGSGNVIFSMGSNGSSYNNFVTSMTVAPGDPTTTSGHFNAQLGSALLASGVPQPYMPTPTETVTLRINATSHLGTVTAGTLVGALLLMPVNGWT